MTENIPSFEKFIFDICMFANETAPDGIAALAGSPSTANKWMSSISNEDLATYVVRISPMSLADDLKWTETVNDIFDAKIY